MKTTIRIVVILAAAYFGLILWVAGPPILGPLVLGWAVFDTVNLVRGRGVKQ